MTVGFKVYITDNDLHGINLHRLTEQIYIIIQSYWSKEGSCSRESACVGDTKCSTFAVELCCLFPTKVSELPMPTKRSCLSKIVLLPLFVFSVSVLVEESNQHILRSSSVESPCLRRCVLLRAVKRSKIKVGFKSSSLVYWDPQYKLRYSSSSMTLQSSCSLQSLELREAMHILSRLSTPDRRWINAFA